MTLQNVEPLIVELPRAKHEQRITMGKKIRYSISMGEILVLTSAYACKHARIYRLCLEEGKRRSKAGNREVLLRNQRVSWREIA